MKTITRSRFGLYLRSLQAQGISLFTLSRRGPGQRSARLTNRNERLLGAPGTVPGAARRFHLPACPPALGAVCFSLAILASLALLLRPHPEALALPSELPVAPMAEFDSPIPRVGASSWANLPDGQRVWTTYRGEARSFRELPPHPQPGDTYQVDEGPGTYWIWATPLGFTKPAWVDP